MPWRRLLISLGAGLLVLGMYGFAVWYRSRGEAPPVILGKFHYTVAVCDAVNLKPIPRAKVRAIAERRGVSVPNPPQVEAEADEAGRIRLRLPEGELVRIRVAAPGYEPYLATLDPPNDIGEEGNPFLIRLCRKARTGE